MAFLVLRVVLLGVLAAAADDVPVLWAGGRVSLQCQMPEPQRFAPRPPPPPIDADDRHARPKPYAWAYDGETVAPKRVSTNGSLEVARRRDGEGLYQCSTKYHGRTVLGYPLQVKFASIEQHFSVSPADARVQVGQPAVFSCDISSAPPAVVSWLKDGQPLPRDERFYTLPNELLILDVNEDDNGSYSCIATNPVLNRVRTSSPGRLTVVPAAGELALEPLDLRLEGHVEVPRGGLAVLACPVTGRPISEMIWQLTPPGGRTAELAATEQVLVLNHAELDQEGVYTCRVDGQDKVIRTFNVTITEPPKVLLPPISKESLRASTVRFNCTASGRPQPKITWFKDGEKLQFNGRARIIKSYDEANGSGDRMELVISGITSEDAGIYQCFATNGVAVASSWAELNVTGASTAAPASLSCRPAGARSVALRWSQPEHGTVVAYTVHIMRQVTTGEPILVTYTTVQVAEPFTPYGFQVRAYITSNSKSGASDYSETVYCEGQGVPVQLTKLPNSKVQVSWRQFAAQTSGVIEWILQTKPENTQDVTNVTLPGNRLNYTLDVSSGHFSVRVLGTKSRPWMEQDLSLLPWSSTAQARDRNVDGEFDAIPTDLVVSELTSSGFTLTWRCEEADASRQHYSFIVCLKKTALANDKYSCHESFNKRYSVEGLEGDTQYSVKVQARVATEVRGGPFTAPLVIRTLKPVPSRFSNVKPVYVNESTAVIEWGGDPLTKYIVRYNSQLSLPVEAWEAQVVKGDRVVITLNPVNNTYVMVATTQEPIELSNVFTIYSQNSKELAKELAKNKNNDAAGDPTDVQDVRHEYTSDGIAVSWAGPPGARYRVRYSQNLVSEMEAWKDEYVDRPAVLLSGINPSLPTHVQVHLVRPDDSRPRPDAPVYTLPPAPRQPSSFYLGIGIAVAVCLICMMLVAAFCIWRRRKRQQSPSRARRRHVSTNDSNGEEGSEMTNIGGRLANGGATRGAGEPLLNGHVHITENPTIAKTPNGKTRKSRGRPEPAAFDVSRIEEPDTTAETTLETDVSTPYDYLDTSRLPGDSTRSSLKDISTNNSFNKLPDDNMNSELTRSSDFVQKDNSNVQPTLQPNG